MVMPQIICWSLQVSWCKQNFFQTRIHFEIKIRGMNPSPWPNFPQTIKFKNVNFWHLELIFNSRMIISFLQHLPIISSSQCVLEIIVQSDVVINGHISSSYPSNCIFAKIRGHSSFSVSRRRGPLQLKKGSLLDILWCLREVSTLIQLGYITSPMWRVMRKRYDCCVEQWL